MLNFQNLVNNNNDRKSKVEKDSQAFILQNYQQL